MKLIRILCLILACVLVFGSLVGCGKKKQEEETQPEVYTFDAYVFERNSSSILVGPMSGELEISAAMDKGILLNIHMLDGSSLDWLEPGMLIRVTYNGMITYSIPAKIAGVISVEVLED